MVKILPFMFYRMKPLCILYGKKKSALTLRFVSNGEKATVLPYRTFDTKHSRYTSLPLCTHPPTPLPYCVKSFLTCCFAIKSSKNEIFKNALGFVLGIIISFRHQQEFRYTPIFRIILRFFKKNLKKKSAIMCGWQTHK